MNEPGYNPDGNTENHRKPLLDSPIIQTLIRVIVTIITITLEHYIGNRW